MVEVEYLDSATSRVLRKADLRSVPYRKIRTWVEDCKEHDQYNLVPDGLTVEFKVIDCRTKPPRISKASKGCRYVALSYVWGSSAEGKSYKLDAGLEGNLPQTTTDSIKVTQELGFDCLWIDRYVCTQSRISIRLTI